MPIDRPGRALWVILTYREVMTDQERLYRDFHAFWKRFLRWEEKEGHPRAEYIAAAEPQWEVRAWHLHLVILYPRKAPLHPLPAKWPWQNGARGTKTKSMKVCDNPGIT